jgi:hypothetical protein
MCFSRLKNIKSLTFKISGTLIVKTQPNAHTGLNTTKCTYGIKHNQMHIQDYMYIQEKPIGALIRTKMTYRIM